MLRAVAFLTCCAVASISRAQVYTWQPGDKAFKSLGAGAGTEAPSAPRRVLIRPQEEPTPALKYQYHGSRLDKKPGNAVAHLLRAHIFFSEPPMQATRKKWDKEYPKANDVTLQEFPKEAVREYLDQSRNVIVELHSAAEAERIEYGHALNNLHGPEVFTVLLPEVQEARQLSRLLDLEARLAIAEGRFDDAIRSLKSGFRMAEIVGEMQSSTLIGKLVSISITSIMLDRSLELSQQPGAPNVYWALASIPESAADMRSAVEGESHMIGNAFFDVMNLDSLPLSDAGWQERAVRSVQDFMGLANSLAQDESAQAKQEIQARLATGLLVLGYGEAARVELRKQGFTSQDTSMMSSSEAILRSTKLSLEQSRDRFFRWSLLPRSISRQPYMTSMEEELGSSPLNPTGAIVRLLFPAVNAAGAAGDRTLTKRNQLILIEALRAYAAANDGTLPDKLDDLRPFPVWPHPVGGRSFEYKKLSSSEAMLTRAEFYPQDLDASWHLVIAPAN